MPAAYKQRVPVYSKLGKVFGIKADESSHTQRYVRAVDAKPNAGRTRVP